MITKEMLDDVIKIETEMNNHVLNQKEISIYGVIIFEAHSLRKDLANKCIDISSGEDYEFSGSDFFRNVLVPFYRDKLKYLEEFLEEMDKINTNKE